MYYLFIYYIIYLLYYAYHDILGRRLRCCGTHGRWMATRAWDRRQEMTAEGADAAASLRQAVALYVGPKLPDEPEGAPVHA
jgi:hypothetical protein